LLRLAQQSGAPLPVPPAQQIPTTGLFSIRFLASGFMLILRILARNVSRLLLRAAGSKYFSQNRRVAGILDIKVDCVADVIEKGFETGVAVSFGGLFGSLGDSCQKGQDFIRGDGFQFSITKFV
jgi:hypothetical protein